MQPCSPVLSAAYTADLLRDISVLLGASIRMFRAAMSAEDPVELTAGALERLCQAAVLDTSNDPLSDDPLTTDLLLPLAPRLLAATAPIITKEQIAWGMSCANGLLQYEPDGCKADRILHTEIFAATLRIHARRKQIARRGDPLMRLLAIYNAAQAEVSDHTLQ